MSSKTKQIIGVIAAGLAIIIIGTALIVALSDDNDDDQSQSSTTKTTTATPETTITEESANELGDEEGVDSETEANNAGQFVEYSQSAFDSDTNSKKVLFFHQKSCSVCKQIETNMKAGVMPEGVSLYLVPMETETALVEKYSVNLQTTFIEVDDEGNQLQEWNWLSKPSAGVDDLALQLNA